MFGPSGVIVPLLLKLGESSAGSTPNVSNDWFNPAGP